eukprot:gi/632964973/ref/XP_007898660.1/ PREDICTED: uncharacterized protein LOC103183151 [Callorhinchus milii]
MSIIFGVTLILMGFVSSTWMELLSPPPGLLQSGCYDRLFWMRLNGSFLHFWSLGVADSVGKIYPLAPLFATECGYTISEDPFGNVDLRASVMACLVENQGDEMFTLTVQIQISATSDMTVAQTYQHTMKCSYYPWMTREILCEKNYMEVSVQRIIPGIEDDYHEDWIAAIPSAQEAESAIWQVVFHLLEGMKTMMVNETTELGYRIDTTVARLVLRAPYNTTEVELMMIHGVSVSSIRSTTFYKQKWLIFLIDTAVACPVDGTTFTQNAITWTIPRAIPPLSLEIEKFFDNSIILGVNNTILDQTTITKRHYTLEYNDTNIVATIPVGAEGGYYKSYVSEGQYGIKYYIDLMMQHQWKDDTWELTKYTVIHPVVTPFMPQPLIVINNTIPETRVFNVTLGYFLQDVDLITVTIGMKIVTVDQVDKIGFRIYEIALPNNTKAYILEVPFDNIHIQQKHVHSDTRQYIIDVIYTLTVLPENDTFIKHIQIIHEVQDIVIPKAVASCDAKNLYLLVNYGNLKAYWLPFIGNTLITPKFADENSYALIDNGTHILFGIPHTAAGVITEELNLYSFKARFNLTLKSKNTPGIEINFFVSCKFPTVEFIVCFPNGTMAVVAVVETVPDLDPGKMVLKDGKCHPQEFDQDKAFFRFNVDSCGTTHMIKGNYLIYENEVSYPRELIPVDSPVITRDPEYRLTVSCHYQINETLVVGFARDYKKSLIVSAPAATDWYIVRGRKQPRWTLNLHSRIYKNASYLDFYREDEYPVVKYWTDSLYFEVELSDQGPQTELLLDRCWITESPDHHSLPERIIIQNGQVYFHCSTVMCNTKQQVANSFCNGQCTPGTIGKKTGSDLFQSYVPLGEVWILSGETTEKFKGIKHTRIPSHLPLKDTLKYLALEPGEHISCITVPGGSKDVSQGTAAQAVIGMNILVVVFPVMNIVAKQILS